MSLTQISPLLFMRFVYDLLLSLVFLAVGRILPPLHVASVDLTGKTAIVTGSNSGIGLSLAKSLARQNATVVMACRSLQRGTDAAREILDSLPNDKGLHKRIHVLQLDTSDLKSVRAFADFWRKNKEIDRSIDILIHNAGISGCPSGSDGIKDGLGLVYTTNFLGSFLLTSLLEPFLSSNARVILTSSFGQYGGKPFDVLGNKGYLPLPGKANDSGFYASTKSMQVIFARLLQRRWNRATSSMTKRIAHSFTPGYTSTPIFEKMNALPPAFDPTFWLLKTSTALSTPVDVGAATGLWLATTADPMVTNPVNGGGYWDRLVRRLPTADILEAARGKEDFEQLWNTWCRDSSSSWQDL